jgi:hypothetical protein
MEELDIIYDKIKNKTLLLEDIGGIEFERCHHYTDHYQTLFSLKNDKLTIDNIKYEIIDNDIDINDMDTYFRVYTKDCSMGTGGLSSDFIFHLIQDEYFEKYFDSIRGIHFNYEKYYSQHQHLMIYVFQELIVKTWHYDRVDKWCL